MNQSVCSARPLSEIFFEMLFDQMSSSGKKSLDDRTQLGMHSVQKNMYPGDKRRAYILSFFDNRSITQNRTVFGNEIDARRAYNYIRNVSDFETVDGSGVQK